MTRTELDRYSDKKVVERDGVRGKSARGVPTVDPVR